MMTSCSFPTSQTKINLPPSALFEKRPFKPRKCEESLFGKGWKGSDEKRRRTEIVSLSL